MTKLKKKKKLSEFDFGTPELQAKTVKTLIGGSMRLVQTQLDFLLHQMVIDERQFLAGQKLAMLHYMSGQQKLCAFSFDKELGVALLDDEQEQAIDRFRRQLRAGIAALDYSNRSVTIDVCCYDKNIYKNYRLTALLKCGLDELAKHFDI